MRSMQEVALEILAGGCKINQLGEPPPENLVEIRPGLHVTREATAVMTPRYFDLLELHLREISNLAEELEFYAYSHHDVIPDQEKRL